MLRGQRLQITEPLPETPQISFLRVSGYTGRPDDNGNQVVIRENPKTRKYSLIRLGIIRWKVDGLDNKWISLGSSPSRCLLIYM